MNDILVKTLNKREEKEIKKLNKIKLKHFVEYFIILSLACSILLVIAVLKAESSKVFIEVLIGFLLVELACSLVSYLIVFLTAPKGLFNKNYKLICNKCRGRIFESKDGMYKCHCGNSWDRFQLYEVCGKKL